jgi:hypothetical protein
VVVESLLSDGVCEFVTASRTMVSVPCPFVSHRMTPTLMPTATSPEMTDTRITLRLLPVPPEEVAVPRVFLLFFVRDFLESSREAGGMVAGISEELMEVGSAGTAKLDAIRVCAAWSL